MSAGKGRRSSTTNTGLQVGLSKTPIGGDSFRLLCMSADIPPPSSSGLQKAANKVCSLVEDENLEDMKKRRNELKFINRCRGKISDSVSMSTDGMYNNPLSTGVGKTPFQPATQVTYVAAENETSDHQILALATKSKLCSKHHLVNNETCVNNPNCSANLHMSDSIGNEKNLAAECFRDLKKDGIEIEFLTTDADSAAYTAAADMFASGEVDTCPEYFLDTRHLSASQRRFIKNSKSVIDMMPTHTKQGKQNLANTFSLDCAARCQAEFSTAYQCHTGDVGKLKKALAKASNAIAYCYMGDHSKCRYSSFVCDMGQKAWINRSKYLEKSFKIDKNQKNLKTLKTCIDYRLGPNRIEQTKFNLNTQKCEATNKAMRRSLPRDTTFTRNFSGRAHSAVHSVNCKSSAKSVEKLRQRLGCPVSENSKIKHELESSHIKTIKSKESKKSIVSKQRRAQRKLELFHLHRSRDIHYSKNMLLNK